MGLVDACDGVTLLRVAQARDQTSTLLKPLVANGLLTREKLGRSVLYRLVETAWTPAFRALARRISELEPSYSSLAHSACTLMISGERPHRKYLIRML